MEPDHERFTFTAELNQAQLTRAVRYPIHWPILLGRCLGAFMALYGLAVAIYGDTVAGLWCLAFGVLLAFGLPWLQIRRASGHVRSRLRGPITYRFDDDGIHTAAEHADGVLRWPLIDQVRQQPDLLLLRLGKHQVIPVPVGPLPPETRTELTAFAQSHIARATAGSATKTTSESRRHRP
jgi:hypothetical protein